MVLEADSLKVVRGAREILAGVSFRVEQGQIYVLLGGNGAGKSTTLLSFLGFCSPASGHVKVKGTEPAEDLTQVRSAIAYLPESASLYEHLNALENLHYFLRLSGNTVGSEQIHQVLDQVALPQAARSQRLKSYSKGMRQKVAIALALLRASDILLLDEPTSGLDPAAIDEFHGLLRQLADAGKTILMVSHDVYGACQIADRIGLLRDGVIAGEFAAPSRGGIAVDAVYGAFIGQQPAVEAKPCAV